MLLSNKVAIVTGGSRGIGKAIVDRLSLEGANVIILDVDDEGGSSAKEMSIMGQSVDFHQVDITNWDTLTGVINDITAKFGGIDILVNNAGINNNATVAESSPADWDHVLRVNLFGSYLISKLVCQKMIDSGRGDSIIFMSSQAGKRGEAGASAYSASKFGMIGLMQCLALEMAPYGMRVNAVCPGNIDTPMLHWLVHDFAKKASISAQEEEQNLLRTIPMGRLGDPHEIAEVVLFLASSASSYISGESINVDGGQLSG